MIAFCFLWGCAADKRTSLGNPGKERKGGREFVEL
jgi:hypothetical protein